MRFRLMMPDTGESSGMRFLRFMLIIAVFVGVAKLYAWHFDKQLEEINAKTGVLDTDGILDSDMKRNIREMADIFKNDFGLDLRVQVHKGPLDNTPQLTPKTVFVALDIQNQTLQVRVPVVWERTIGREFFDTLERDHMLPYFVADDWSIGLFQAIADIWNKMAAIESRETAGRVDEAGKTP